MTSLPSLLGAMTAILQAHPLCRQITNVETKEFSADQFLFKIRVELEDSSNLQVRLYYNRGHIDYAYQLFTDVPLLRWDNKEEFDYISTYPHHHHDEQGKVHPSPLMGDPVNDVQTVLQAVSDFISSRS
ncbi:MAG: toxin-antitoxin system TumE family protein [Anaerolineae bacterium]